MSSSTQPDSRVRKKDIVERTTAFTDRIVQVSFALPNNPAGWQLGKQIVAAGTSVGANVEEAQAGESRADFLHKMRIARKECRETRYFLHRIANASLIPRRRLLNIFGKADELVKVLTSIIRSTDGHK